MGPLPSRTFALFARHLPCDAGLLLPCHARHHHGAMWCPPSRHSHILPLRHMRPSSEWDGYGYSGAWQGAWQGTRDGELPGRHGLVRGFRGRGWRTSSKGCDARACAARACDARECEARGRPKHGSQGGQRRVHRCALVHQCAATAHDANGPQVPARSGPQRPPCPPPHYLRPRARGQACSTWWGGECPRDSPVLERVHHLRGCIA